MKYPNLNEEKKLWKKGYKLIIGLDEAGRGPVAGPVVAGAVLFNNFQFSFDAHRRIPRRVLSNFQSIFNEPIFKKIKDSKMLSPKQREEIYNAFKKHPSVKWGIGIVSENIIDKINILEATKLAMKKAIADLIKNSSVHNLRYRVDYEPSCFLILDGDFGLDINIPQKSIIKADQKVFSCALASIFAKVRRDKIMEKEHKKYPQYGFNKHKGYGTAYHFKMIEKYGPCKIHRKTFYPINNLYKK